MLQLKNRAFARRMGPSRVWIFTLLVTLAVDFSTRFEIANAGSTGSTALINMIGSGASTSTGDMISSNQTDGLNTRYNFFIEVPSGQSSLQIDIFDADVNLGETGGNDVRRSTANTQVRYQVRDPDNTTMLNMTLSPGSCGSLGSCNNGWVNIYTRANPAAGHWQLRVFMSSAVTVGDDTNGFGVRAHDGNSGAGGTEYNIYANSMFASGRIGTGSTTTTLYPWVHSGCQLDANDFDTDRNTISGNSWSLRDRTTSFTSAMANATLSGNNAWVSHNITGWTTDQSASGYGIWRSQFVIAANNGATENSNVFYFGLHDNNDADVPPPTSNPESHTLRIYFPTDAGGAPSKPYIEQYVGHRSGSNPFAIGTSTRVDVTVRVYNPTLLPITVSGTYGGNDRELRANVPSNADLAVAPSVSQGTVTQQPSIGGSGVIRWQPGVIAGGGDAAMTWSEDIVPADGATFLITGDETTAQGTRMLFLDTTGDVDRATANQTIGNICALRGQATVSVYSSLVDVVRRMRNGRATVEWDTTSEIGAYAFVVEKENARTHEFEAVHEGLVPALLDAPQGGHYVVRDLSNASPRRGLYRIREIDVHGAESVHGPYALEDDGLRLNTTVPLLRDGYLRTARWGIPVSAPLSAPSYIPASRNSAPLDAAKIAIRARGMHRVPAETIADALGRSTDEVRAALLSGSFSLSRRGMSVAWTSSDTGDALVFFAEPAASIYTNDTVYRLAIGAGERMATRDLATPMGLPLASSYLSTTHVEQDLFAATAVTRDAESDYWFWKVVSSFNPDLAIGRFSLALDQSVDSSQEAELTIHAFGVTENLHRASVAINGIALGEVHTASPGFGPTTLTLAVPAGLLHTGENEVVINALRSDAIDSSFYIDSLSLLHARRFVASDSRLEFTSADDSALRIEGFATPDVRLFDVSVPERPVLVLGHAVEEDEEGHYSLRFEASAGSKYIAANVDAMQEAARVWGDLPSELRSSANEAAYLVIAPLELRDQAVRLANTRLARGLTAMVVTLDDIYDEFNHAMPNPHAISDFLRYANATWEEKPRYVALAGAQSFDYRDVQGMGGNLVPSIMIRTGHGLFPSDNSFVDFDADGAPDIALGRLPVSSPDELDALVEKIDRYERSEPAAWTDRVLMVNDIASGADFSSMSVDIAAGLAAEYRVATIDADELGIEDAHVQLMRELDSGVFAINYLGHGSTDRLSAGGLLDASHALSLTNAERLPVVTAASCLVAGFGLPGFSSVGEQLVRNGSGGAIAVWSPSSITDAAISRDFAHGVLREVLSHESRPIGDAVQDAIRFLLSRNADPTTMATFALLGDPALLLLHAKAPALEAPDESVNPDPALESSQSTTGCTIAHASTRGASMVIFALLIVVVVFERRRAARRRDGIIRRG